MPLPTLKLTIPQYRMLRDFINSHSPYIRIEPGVSSRMKLRPEEIPAWKRLVRCIPAPTVRANVTRDAILSKLNDLEAREQC
jgi:hypothetical protein